MTASVMEICSKPAAFHILHNKDISFTNIESAEDNIAAYHELVSKFIGVRFIIWDMGWNCIGCGYVIFVGWVR